MKYMPGKTFKTRKISGFLLPEPNDLKIRCPQGRVGSSPSSGIGFSQREKGRVVTPCSWSRRRVGGCCWVICCVVATKSAAINGALKFGGWLPPPVAVPAVSGSPVVERG